MFRSSVLMSTCEFQSLSPMTLARWSTFWSKVRSWPIQFHMQEAPPMTLTPGTKGSKEQASRQCSYLRQSQPPTYPKPTSRQVRSQLERMTSLGRPTSLLTVEVTPHHWMTSSSCTGRSISSLAQQITFFWLEMFLQSCFWRSRKSTESSLQSAISCSCIQSLISVVFQQSYSTSSPPKCTYWSSKARFTCLSTSPSTCQVRSRVGSSCPSYAPSQFKAIPRYFSLRPQDSECAGVSISGTTRIPRERAQVIRLATSTQEQTPLRLPAWLSSGTVGTKSGKES